MPFTMPNFQPLSPEQSDSAYGSLNSVLQGLMKAPDLYKSVIQAAYTPEMLQQDLLTKQISNQLNQVKAKYADSMAQQDLQSKVLTNKWFGPEKQSEIGLRGAQKKEATARAGSLGTESQMNQLKLNYMKQYLGQNTNQSSNSNYQLQNDGSSSQIQENQQQMVQPSSPGQNISQPSSMNVNQSSGGSDQAINYPQSSSITPVASHGVSTGQNYADGQSTNNIYGIQTPTPTKDDIANQMFFGMDTFTPRLQNAKTQQQDQYTQYQKEISQTLQEANTATKLKQNLSIFNKAMDNSFYKGQLRGSMPSKGLSTALLMGHDLSNEQIADQQISNMLPGAMAEMRDAMGDGKFSNMDMMAASNMKFSRNMDDKTRKIQSDFINGIYNRMEEKAKFYTLMGNPKGPQKNIADMAWQAYQENFPISGTDEKGNLSNKPENLKNWPLYTTPKAIDSIQRTGTYQPSEKEKNTFYMKFLDDKGEFKILPVKKGQVESAFRKGAIPL